MEDNSLIRQVQKEFDIDKSEVISWEDLKEKWGQYFNSLIENDFQKLVSFLYRVDVSENKLKSMLRENPGENAGKIIATLLIERLLQKIRSREEHRSKTTGYADDPGTEEW